MGLPTTQSGEIAPAAAAMLEQALERADAVLVGPAMANGEETRDLTRVLLASATGGAMVLDAGAVSSAASLADDIRRARCTVVMTPHCGEMAALMKMEKVDVENGQLDVARAAADRFGAIVILKSATTVIANPNGEILIYASECPGLGTAGSGDVLAGIIAGLLARRAEPLTAAAWGVWLHGACGRAISQKVGAIGFIARELPPLLPGLLAQHTD
jgi:hydroxyethylthiazole kinase-like uncharacterized protein yjeF